MNEMQKFRNNAQERGLCEKYAKLWDECISNRRLVDLALDSNGIPYLCESIVRGWGLSVTYLSCRFRMYINNRYTSCHDGYTSKLYVSHKDNVVANATNMVFIDCCLCVVVPKNTICNLYVANSKIDVVGEGVCYVKRYGRSSVNASKNVKIVKK